MRKKFEALALGAVTAASILLAGGTASATPADRCDPDGWCHRSFHAAFNDGSGNLDGFVSYKWHVSGYEGDVHGTTRDTKADGLCIAAETYADGIVEMLPDSYVCGTGHSAHFRYWYEYKREVYLRVCTVKDGVVHYCGRWR